MVEQAGGLGLAPSTSTTSTSGALAGPISRRYTVVARASSGDEKPANYNKEFGYSRKDVIIIGAALIALGYAMYYGLQAAGMEPGMAGNWVQLVIFVGICIGWVSTYVYRVATKVRIDACLRVWL